MLRYGLNEAELFAAPVVVRPERDESVLVGHRQGADHQPVHDREQRDGAADAQGERECCQDTECGVLSELPYREAEISGQVGDGIHSPRLPGLLLEALRTAEFHMCSSAGFIRGESPRFVFFCFLLQVEREFFVQLSLHVTSGPQ